NLDKYSEVVEGKISEEDQKLTQGVVNQVNTFITEYGKKNGYSIIYGTNLSGNIIYGADAYDLTNEILTELNNQYKSAPAK
ncbi:MAG TPA: OmpH family outer membrane protein, partial [Cytophagales bacterium]|nr:OmpH family outer membrane protein [Cytophagales bacterium]